MELKRDDVAAVMATSGTTGKSKGVVYTHERLLANMHIVMGLYRKGDGTEPYLHLGRTTHATSLQLLEFAASGQALIRLPMRYCAPERVLQAIHDYKVPFQNLSIQKFDKVTKILWNLPAVWNECNWTIYDENSEPSKPS